MKYFSKIIVGVLFAILFASQAVAGTTRKSVKSGEKTLIYQSQFLGVPPRGVKVPQAEMVQPKKGKLTLKKSVKGSGRSKVTLYQFYYKSRAGYKGKDEARAIVNFFVRRKDGKQSKIPTTNERLVLRVK